MKNILFAVVAFVCFTFLGNNVGAQDMAIAPNTQSYGEQAVYPIEASTVVSTTLVKHGNEDTRFIPLRATAITDGNLIQWNFNNSPQKVMSAVLERSENGKDFQAIATLAGDKQGFTDVTRLQQAYYRILIRFEQGMQYTRTVTCNK